MFSILLTILIFMCGACLVFNASNNLRMRVASSNTLRALNKEINSWEKITAKVIKVEVNCDHAFPGISPDSSDIEGPIEKERFEIEFIKNLTKVKEDNLIYGGVNVSYEYTYNGKIMTSRAIGLLPSVLDFDIANKVKVGSKINVFVNPEDSAESYIRKVSKSEIESELNSAFVLFVPHFLGGVALIIMSILSKDLPLLIF
ncbi:DUF3592 domain-containing protein [Psychromonas sp. SP041]|uniref:DUF3592 domain-containing protein n=1 Tax=Psychromonas sp. SP041 TaxID=1365007 RepID=UPI0010C7B483|nr:DUF3592 domain-containing protein [Psychromonas sp. SP041]